MKAYAHASFNTSTYKLVTFVPHENITITTTVCVTMVIMHYCEYKTLIGVFDTQSNGIL